MTNSALESAKIRSASFGVLSIVLYLYLYTRLYTRGLVRTVRTSILISSRVMYSTTRENGLFLRKDCSPTDFENKSSRTWHTVD